MSRDLASTQLPPADVKLRLPPTSRLPYEQMYAQVRRHLKDDGKQATMSVRMQSQVSAIRTESVRADTPD